jgi:hypothetical protein
MTAKNFSRKVVTPVRFQLIEETTSNPLTQLMNGFTAEVSQDGVKIAAPMSEAEAETLVGQYALIKLSFQLPGTSKIIATTATIANFIRGATVSNATMITFGVSFVAIDYSAQDVIGEFILQRNNSPVIKGVYHFIDTKVLNFRRKHQVPCFA